MITKSTFISATLALLLIGGGMGHADDRARGKVNFAGLTHTPLGNARLTPKENKLVVGNLGLSGVDGISVAVKRAIVWSSDLIVNFHREAATNLTFTAFGQGRKGPISSLIGIEENDNLSILTDFGSPTFRVQVFNEGTLVYEETGYRNSSQGAALGGSDSWCELFNSGVAVQLGICEFVSNFNINPDGSCQWSLIFPSAIPIDRIDPVTSEVVTRVSGDEVRLIENLEYTRGQATFETMRVQGSLTPLITFVDESVKQRRGTEKKPSFFSPNR